MSGHRKKISEEVQKTLSGLDRIENIETDSYFFARLKNRMEREADRFGHSPLVNRKRQWLIPAVLAVAITVNVFTAVKFLKTSDQSKPTRQDYLELLANDYFPDWGNN